MKRYFQACLAGMFFVVSSAGADEVVVDTDILASRGKGVVTQDEFDARVDRIPPDVRYSTLRHTGRFRDVLNSLLLKSQLAADAREAGFDKQKIVVDRMQLAGEMELADAWLEHYVEQQGDADYEALAYETYQLRQDEFLTAPRIDVSHILISTAERTDEEAKSLADSVHEKIEANPASFDELVGQYSEDPSAVSNKGKFKSVKKGDMVKPFEEAAFALGPGQFSQPVKTVYGYHIIRLDAHIKPQNLSFAEVRESLVDAERTKHKDRIRNDYLSKLTALEVDMSEEALREMVRRQFGDEVLVPEAGAEKTE